MTNLAHTNAPVVLMASAPVLIPKADFFLLPPVYRAVINDRIMVLSMSRGKQAFIPACLI